MNRSPGPRLGRPNSQQSGIGPGTPTNGPNGDAGEGRGDPNGGGGPRMPLVTQAEVAPRPRHRACSTHPAYMLCLRGVLTQAACIDV